GSDFWVGNARTGRAAPTAVWFGTKRQSCWEATPEDLAMTPQSPSLLSSLPAWARQLSESYYSGAFTLFVIHGNVRDLVTLKRDTAPEFLSLHAFLQQVLFGQR